MHLESRPPWHVFVKHLRQSKTVTSCTDNRLTSAFDFDSVAMTASSSEDFGALGLLI
jgi:hypothetical protein